MIDLNLDNLTKEHVLEALPTMGCCRYDAPCIIGTLMTPEERACVAHQGQGVLGLVYDGAATLPEEQYDEADRLQMVFDSGNRAKFLALPRIAKLMAA